MCASQAAVNSKVDPQTYEEHGLDKNSYALFNASDLQDGLTACERKGISKTFGSAIAALDLKDILATLEHASSLYFLSICVVMYLVCQTCVTLTQMLGQ
jgi:hypothetical protein